MRRLLPLLLLPVLACHPMAQPPADTRPFAQAEEGLTLVFGDPSLKEPEASAQRLQVRVEHVTRKPDGSIEVVKQFIRGMDQPFYTRSLLKDGGVSLLDAKGEAVVDLLPQGFPDRVRTWSSPPTAKPEARTVFTVIGRGAWVGNTVLPPGTDQVGVWVEARPPHGLRLRSLYLRGLGEVETLEEQPGGAWVSVNRLLQRGFVDPPAAPSN